MALDGDFGVTWTPREGVQDPVKIESLRFHLDSHRCILDQVWSPLDALEFIQRSLTHHFSSLGLLFGGFHEA